MFESRAWPWGEGQTRLSSPARDTLLEGPVPAPPRAPPGRGLSVQALWPQTPRMELLGWFQIFFFLCKIGISQ